MEIYCQGTATVRHADTGKVYEIRREELEWSQDGGDERSMGGSLRYAAEVDHPDLGLLTWEVWEYPIGAEELTQTTCHRHELLSDFNFGLEHELEDEPEGWDYEEVPNDPFSIFYKSVSQASTLLANVNGVSESPLLNRMVFSHYITAMEAYLGDALLNEVMESPAAMNRLLVKAEGLSDAKFSLANISQQPSIVNDETRKYLRSIIYHNLAKVEVLYSIALGIKILELTTDKDILFRAVHLRHDCVHRNGMDKNGEELTVFTKAFVQETGDKVLNFVRAVNMAVTSSRYSSF